MYEKLVFADIETVYDYFDYMKTKDDRKAYSTKYPVKLWDDYDKKYNHYYFSYGCVGDTLVSVDGQSSQRGSRSAFTKIEVEKKKPNQLLIGHFDL